MVTITKVLKGLRHPKRAAEAVLVELAKSRVDLDEERQRLFQHLEERFGVDARVLRDEYLASDFFGWFRQRLAELPSQVGTTSAFDCEALYLIVRAAKPRTMVETGVLHGASSAHILHAMAENGKGHLHSIDLPKGGDAPPQDFLVPPQLRDRWSLNLGDAVDLLPEVLSRLGKIDLFHHDSLHTFDHMLFEYETAFQYLDAGGVLTSHDVVSGPFGRGAFEVFCERHQLPSEVFRNVGIAHS